MTELRPTASDIHIGGGNVSMSMLGTWWRCQRQWFWQYLYPWPTGERGIESRYTGSPLMIGSGVHAGLQAWYMSGWKDGDYVLDAALEAVRAVFRQRVAEFESEERYAGDLAEVERLLRAYAAEYGPSAPIPEFTTFRPAQGDDGKPLIEVTFTITLSTGHSLTVRPDMVAWNHGMLVPVEHKTPGASRVGATIGEAGLGAQGLAQAAILRRFDVPVGGGQLLNLIVKGDLRAGKYTNPRQRFQRHVVGFDPHNIDHALATVERTIADVERATSQFHELCDDGMSPTESMRAAFPMTGIFNGQCHRYNRPCAMYALCSAPGREHATLTNYRVRSYKTDTVTREEESA